MSIGEKVIDSITKSLFESAKIDPYRFRNQAKQTLRKDFDHFSEPFKLNKEEKEIKSGLFNVVKGNLDNGAIIQPISRDLLQSAIRLEAPRQVREFTATTDNKLKSRSRKSAGGAASANTNSSGVGTKRGFADTDSRTSSDLKKAKTDQIEPNFRQIALETASKFSHTLPTNFYDVINRLFDEFWALQFDDKEVDFAFFAKITIHNCRDYGLSTFSENSYSLGVIKVKLQNREYLSIDDFLHDFSQLFANILKYYAESHPAYKKAIELRNLFDQKWTEYIQQFKWR